MGIDEGHFYIVIPVTSLMAKSSNWHKKNPNKVHKDKDIETILAYTFFFHMTLHLLLFKHAESTVSHNWTDIYGF